MDGDRDFRFSPRPNRAAEIAWRPWGEPAFAEARQLGRPLLLSLSAVWCHWCHVMDETSYSDPRVIAALNEHFVPVRVDNDRHPDVNRRYNMGGWPTTAFLAASGEAITGATYLAPDQMLETLARVKAFFDANRAELLALGANSKAHAADTTAIRARGGRLPGRDLLADDLEGALGAPGDIPAAIALEVLRAVDLRHGGIGTEPKFPQADVFAYLVAYAGLRGADAPGPDAAAASPGGVDGPIRPGGLRRAIRTTLAAMAGGGLRDHAGGGFFRYATRRDWTVPHYEKMLEDNSRLAMLYLEAAADSGDAASYYEVAADVVGFMLRTLWLEEPPAFGGSQDADEHYYLLDTDGREALPTPFVDATVYVDWNALAARALLRAASRLGRPALAGHATRSLQYLLRNARRDGAMLHYVAPDGTTGGTAPLLVDQATVAAALLDAYEATAERSWLEGARALVAWAGDHLRTPDGRYADRLAAPGASPGLLAQPIPALEDNALLADVLLRLEAYTGQASYRREALEILTAWAPEYERYGVAAAPYAMALLRYLERPDHFVIVGERGDPAVQRLHAAALASPRPMRTVQLLDPSVPDDDARIAEAGYGKPARGPSSDGTAAAYVCRAQVCLPPITDPAELAAGAWPNDAGGRLAAD